ncbi:MAG: polyprenyl synthetase family protein [Myxococcales bacterium]|nr:polyprenyl synthetase family protein [Myxococcales bacterium]USN51723.1 MAG: polyprenyl synthetase family protein [Myxococcales bacterium]
MTATEIQELKSLFENELRKAQKSSGFSSKILNESINYSLSSGGKRLRPLLIFSYAHYLTSHNTFKKALPAALAVEYVHTYSLIHDDLPAMDNDDYRRGRLSTHKRFDEATAILAGDALLADAFFALSHAPVNAALQCQELALACGRYGLVSGQAQDLTTKEGPKTKDDWICINQAKTGRLFEACTTLAALSLGVEKSSIEKARVFGRIFGESFQLKDDLEDSQGIAHFLSHNEISQWLKINIAKMHSLLEENPRNIKLKKLICHVFGIA